VIKVHPDALEDPDISILDNIQHWAHGQIATELVDDNIGSSHPTIHKERKRISRMAGNGWAKDTTSESAAVHEMLQIVKQWPGCAVGMEDFIVRQFNQSYEFLSPVRLTAALDYALWLMGIQSYRQQPSEAKSTVTDERLKLWGFYEKSGAQVHARDADRHCLTFLRKCKDPLKGPARRRLAWPHIYGGG
jgi:hypothetical protein